MPEEKFDSVEKVLSGLEAIKDRAHGRINDLLRQKTHASKNFDEKRKLGWKLWGVLGKPKKASAFATGMKDA